MLSLDLQVLEVFLPSLWSISHVLYGSIMSALFFFFFLHKNKMKISLVTTAPLLILPVRLLLKFRPVLCPDFMSSLREGVHGIAAARSCRVKKCFPTPFHQLFPMDSVLPETAQGLTAKKCHFPIRGWNQTSLAVGHMQCRDDLAQNPSKECTSVVCSQPRALPMALRAKSLLAHVFMYTPCSLSHLSYPVCALFR